MRRILLAVLVSLSMMGGYLASAAPSPNVSIDLVDDYYAGVFAASGQEWVSPEVVIVDEDVSYDGACGVAEDGDGFAGFYCGPDRTVVLESSMLEELGAEFGELLPSHVIAHEFAHHAQELTDIDPGFPEATRENPDWDVVYLIELELMADCLAGSYFAYLDAQDLVSSREVLDVLDFLPNIGDDPFTTEMTGGRGGMTAHGDGVERVTATFRGYDEGVFGCLSINPAEVDPPLPSTPFGIR